MLFVSAGFRFVCVVGLYLLGGFAYQRLVVGAKGFEQIPNYAFWVDFGNLQAVSAVRVTWAGGGWRVGGAGGSINHFVVDAIKYGSSMCKMWLAKILFFLPLLMQARSKQCMIGPAEINTKLPVGGLGRAASPPAGSGA